MPSRNPRTICIALLAASLALSASADVQLLPAGEFVARDGRPGNGKTWKLSDAAGKQIAADLTALAGKTKFLFDYDHQTIRAEANGQKAPAAGWATTFEWRPGQGLFATNVAWTQSALVAINAGEYAYVSPVISFNQADGRVVGVQMAAITNYPALLGMEPLGQALSAQLSAQFSLEEPQEPPMKLLAALAALFALPATATEDEALAAVTKHKTEADQVRAKPVALSGQLVTALGLSAGANEAAALAAITTLQTQAKGTDTTTATTIAALQSQLSTLTTQAAERQVNEVVQAALSAGKLLPAQKAWATDLGKRDLVLLQGFVAGAPTLAALQSQTGGRPPGGSDETGLSAEALAGKARTYQAEQLAAGVQISTAQAVMHVNKGPAPAAE